MAPTSVIKAGSAAKRKRDAVEDADEADSAPTLKDNFRQKVLVLSSRGVTHRMRHVMNDLTVLLPHAKKGKHISTQFAVQS